MITISERIAKDIPGHTSLFVEFQYNAKYVEIMKTCPVALFHRKEKIWEAPVSSLASLIDQFSPYDDLEINLLQDKKLEHKLFEIGPYKLKPFKHQEEAIQYGLNHNKWLLLDLPGLGKTGVIIHIAEELKKREKIEHCLIVCGVNTLKHNWIAEIKKHSNESARILGQRVKKNGKIRVGSMQDKLDDLKNGVDEFFIVTNIETLREKDIIKELNKQHEKYPMIACDEAHVVKNPNSAQGANFLKLNKAKYKIAATGTLLLNSPLDAYVALKWIEVENCNYSTFRNYYEQKQATQFGSVCVGYRNINVLKSVIDSCSLRRTKDLLDLPEKTVINEITEMAADQETFYNNIKSGIIDQVDKVELDASNVLGMITRLRQASVCPGILTSENISSAKIERAKSLIYELTSNGEKVVVFSSFKEPLAQLYRSISDIKTVLCTGDCDDLTIERNKEEFQNSADCMVLLGTIQKMGTGVTLTAATNMIFLDCSWTAGVNAQCEDRIHRIGSKKPVFIYYLWNKDTFDEVMHDIVQDKSIISDWIIDNKVDQTLVDRLRQILLDLK